MARQLSGQYTISSGSTSEKAFDGNDVDGNILNVKNAGSNEMHVGNDGNGAVDNTTGYSLSGGDSVEISVDDQRHGGSSDVYVYGTSGDTLHYVTKG